MLASCGGIVTEKPSENVPAIEEIQESGQAPEPEKETKIPEKVKLGELENVLKSLFMVQLLSRKNKKGAAFFVKTAPSRSFI